jgi:Tfp pilus assembly protein PilF
MVQLYNLVHESSKIVKHLSKTEVLIVLTGMVLLSFGLVSCHRSQAPAAMAVDSGDAQAAADAIAESDRLYAQRGDPAKARMAVAALRQARTADYGNYEAAWKLARADYYLGSHASEDEAEDVFREGIEAGKIAVQLDGNRPEGHFWLGANYGGSAQHSTLAGLASVEDIRREMETVIKMDERFQGASAYMGLGQLYLEAPRVLGGDTAKALDYLQKGIKLAPDNALMRLYLAEAYHAAGRDAEARKQINELMAMTPSPDYLPEYQDAVDRGKKLLEKMK